MAMKGADGGSEGQIAVTEDELRELNYMVSVHLTPSEFLLHFCNMDLTETLHLNVL